MASRALIAMMWVVFLLLILALIFWAVRPRPESLYWHLP